MTDVVSLARLRRVVGRWASRNADYSGLRSLKSIQEVGNVTKSRPIPFFNGNTLRAKMAQGLANAGGCGIFLETGTSHAATAIGAHLFLGLPVASCENNPRDYWISRIMTFGMKDIALSNLDSRRFLEKVLPRVQEKKITPLIYLDAHEGGLDANSLPLIDEIRAILRLESFVVLVDDFRVPGEDRYKWGTYGGTAIEAGLIAPVLSEGGIDRCYFPSYSPSEESGYTSGYCVFWRSPSVDAAYSAGTFPLNLLRPFPFQTRIPSQQRTSSP